MEKLLIAPFTKVDVENRIVSGYATLEVPDKSTPLPEVVDYESAKAAFGKWIGNIREMHLPIAVGKAIEIVPDDDKRGIYISAKISKSRDGEDAWTKIQEKVLTAFSIGMKGVKRSPELFQAGKEKISVNRLTFSDLAETSLVDNPACPGTFFDVVKAAMGETEKQQATKGAPGSQQPAEGTPAASAGPQKLAGLTLSAEGRELLAEGLKCEACDVHAALDILHQLTVLVDNETMRDMAGGNQADNVQLLLESFQRVQEFVASQLQDLLAARPAAEVTMAATSKGFPDAAKRDVDPNVGGGVDRDKLPASDFVDPVRRRFPIVTPADVGDAVSSFGRAKPPIPYESFRRRLTAIARRKGPMFVAALPQEWKDQKAAETEQEISLESLYRLADSVGPSEDVAKALGEMADVLEGAGPGPRGAWSGSPLAVAAQSAEAVKAAFGELVKGEVAGLQAEVAGLKALCAEAAGKAEVGKLSEDLARARGDLESCQAAAEAVRTTLAALSADIESLKGLSADLAGKADVNRLSEDLAKAVGGMEAAQAELLRLARRVESVERTPLPAKVALRTEDLTARGLHQVEKGTFPEAVQAVNAELAELEKRIDEERDPRARERLGEEAGRLRLRLGLL